MLFRRADDRRLGRKDDRQLCLPLPSAPDTERGWPALAGPRKSILASWPTRRAKRPVRAAHQHQDLAVASGISRPRSITGRKPVPPRQGNLENPPDLRLLRRRHPRTLPLLVPCPDAAEGAGRSLCQPEPRHQMGRHYCAISTASERRRSNGNGKHITTCFAVTSQVGCVFQATGMTLPPGWHPRAGTTADPADRRRRAPHDCADGHRSDGRSRRTHNNLLRPGSWSGSRARFLIKLRTHLVCNKSSN